MARINFCNAQPIRASLLSAKLLSLALLSMLLVSSNAMAQRPLKHNQIRGDMPPGVASDMARMKNPRLNFHIQPVQIVSPKGSQIEVGVDEGFVHVSSSKVSLGMFIGPVYRLKVTNIDRHAGKELYPSIELLDKLSPPPGLENDFPIQVVITQDDLEQAIAGNLVTKVIYLEDPNNAVPHKHLQDEQPFFDVGRREDPMNTARSFGRPMAILRIGSRIPMANDRADFNFRSPEPQFLPAPRANAVNPKWQEPIDFPPQNLPNSQENQSVPGTDSGMYMPRTIRPEEAIHRHSMRIPAGPPAVRQAEQLTPSQSVLNR